jgi:hypothetical protein
MFVCRTPYFNCPLLTVVFVRTGSTPVVNSAQSANLGDAESEMNALLAERTWDSAIGLYLSTQIRKNSSH